jgi:hypothetical protein
MNKKLQNTGTGYIVNSLLLFHTDAPENKLTRLSLLSLKYTNKARSLSMLLQRNGYAMV